MSEKPASPRKKRSSERDELVRKHGFYAHTFTTAELHYLEAEPGVAQEFKLLRIKILRLAKLTPLRQIAKDELDALTSLVRIVAALDDMERTGVMRTKAEASMGADLSELDGLDPRDIGAAE